MTSLLDFATHENAFSELFIAPITFVQICYDMWEINFNLVNHTLHFIKLQIMLWYMRKLHESCEFYMKFIPITLSINLVLGYIVINIVVIRLWTSAVAKNEIFQAW